MRLSKKYQKAQSPYEGGSSRYCSRFCFEPMKETDPFYLGARWKRLREHILRRDQYACQECRRYGKRKEAEMVHHCIPRKDFPEIQYSEWNLIALCQQCHEKMHVRTSEDLSQTGIALARRMMKKAGKDEGYLRGLEQRRTEGPGLV